MWPWEHVAVGYLLYSLTARVLGRDPPSDSETALLLAGTQGPDLIDKPLAWGLEWFPSGFAVAHSAFVAFPVGVMTLLVGWRTDRRRVAGAFVVGYWSHLLADVLNPLRNGERPLVSRVLWPVTDVSPYETDYGLARGLVYIREFPRDDPDDGSGCTRWILSGATDRDRRALGLRWRTWRGGCTSASGCSLPSLPVSNHLPDQYASHY
ncbi:MAG: metal-dependent hydrolase [Halorhabdus sp.]